MLGGINKRTKINEIKRFLFLNKIRLFCLIETRVKNINKDTVQKLLGDWSFLDNGLIRNADRIWIL